MDVWYWRCCEVKENYSHSVSWSQVCIVSVYNGINTNIFLVCKLICDAKNNLLSSWLVLTELWGVPSWRPHKISDLGDFTKPQKEVEDRLECCDQLSCAHFKHPVVVVVWTLPCSCWSLMATIASWTSVGIWELLLVRPSTHPAYQIKSNQTSFISTCKTNFLNAIQSKCKKTMKTKVQYRHQDYSLTKDYDPSFT